MIGINNNGEIKVFNAYPESYGQVTQLNKLSKSELYDLGFRIVFDITFTGTNKRGDVFWDEENDRFQYESLEKTPEEIERIESENRINDEAALLEQKFENDGEKLHKRIRHLIRRKVKDETITLTQAKAIRNGLFEPLLPLKSGDWDIAKTRVDAIPIPTNVNLQALLTWIKNKIDTYILNTYE